MEDEFGGFRCDCGGRVLLNGQGLGHRFFVFILLLFRVRLKGRGLCDGRHRQGGDEDERQSATHLHVTDFSTGVAARRTGNFAANVNLKL